MENEQGISCKLEMPEEKQAVWAKGLPEVPKAMFWPGILGGSGESVYVHSDESLMDDGDDERRKDVENYTEWADKISSHARQTIAERKSFFDIKKKGLAPQIRDLEFLKVIAL
uniref:Uncharacterized protein n=1 Tax=Magallana gigas TaxID=29159 RepID=K1QNS1_MAGGI